MNVRKVLIDDNVNILCPLRSIFFILKKVNRTENPAQQSLANKTTKYPEHTVFYPVHSKGEGKIWPVVSTLVLSCYFGLHMQCLFSVCYLLDNYYCPLLLSLLASCYRCFFFIITIVGIIYYLYSFSFNNHIWLLTEDILYRYTVQKGQGPITQAWGQWARP